MKRTGIQCVCGGEFVTDEVTAEAGGQVVTQESGEDHCEKCGRTVEEAAGLVATVIALRPTGTVN